MWITVSSEMREEAIDFTTCTMYIMNIHGNMCVLCFLFKLFGFFFFFCISCGKTRKKFSKIKGHYIRVD